MANIKTHDRKRRARNMKLVNISLLGIFILTVPFIIVLYQQDQRRAADAQTTSLPTFTCSYGATGSSATQAFPVLGATPNDATDDSTAIQTAINNASNAGGGIVNLPAGTFIINKYILLKSNVTLQGNGPQTIIKAGPNFLSTSGPNGGYPLITTNGASNITIKNVTADQSGNTLNGNVSSRLAAYLVDVRNTTNAVIDGVYTRNPFTYSIAVVSSTKFCIKNSNTRVETIGKYNQLDGIHILGSSFGDVINNTVDQRYNNSTDGDDGLVAHTLSSEPTHDVTYAGNVVRGGHNGNSFQLAASDAPIYNITIQNNEFYGAPEGIRTGYYTNGTGNVHDIIIGGAQGKGNIIRDLKPGHAFPDGGQSIWIFDSPKAATNKPYNVTVTYNHICAPNYPIKVVTNPGNIVANNTNCGTPTVPPATNVTTVPTTIVPTFTCLGACITAVPTTQVIQPTKTPTAEPTKPPTPPKPIQQGQGFLQLLLQLLFLLSIFFGRN